MTEITEELNALCYKIVGICMEVHSTLGPGFPEEYYQKAMEYEFSVKQIVFEPQKPVQVFYKEIQVGLNFLDLVVEGQLILELKSVRQLDNVHRFQVIKYLTATEYEAALLVNFGKESFDFERIFPPIKIQKFKNKK